MQNMIQSRPNWRILREICSCVEFVSDKIIKQFKNLAEIISEYHREDLRGRNKHHVYEWFDKPVLVCIDLLRLFSGFVSSLW
jgi:hypothetical protein